MEGEGWRGEGITPTGTYVGSSSMGHKLATTTAPRVRLIHVKLLFLARLGVHATD